MKMSLEMGITPINGVKKGGMLARTDRILKISGVCSVNTFSNSICF